MKKTLITLLALSGLAIGETPAEYTDTYSATSWSNGTLTLNRELNLSLDYWSIEATLTLTPDIGSTSYWGTRFLYTSAVEQPSNNDFFLYLGSMEEEGTPKNPQWANYGYVNLRGLGTQTDQKDTQITDAQGNRLTFDGTYTFKLTRNDDKFNIITLDEKQSIISNLEFNASILGTGTISTLKSDVLVTNANVSNWAKWTKPTVTISTVKPIPEPTTATLSLLALAGLAARRRRK